MQEIIGQVITQLRSAWRYRWYAMACAWVIALSGWAYVLLLPDIFEARARVYVDTDTVLKPLLTGLAVDSNVQNRVGMMSRVLLSRPNMERVARETDLYLRTSNAQAFTALVESLPARITLEGNSRENVYTLKYSDAEPAMAQRVVQTLLDTFVEDTLGVKRADTDTAQSFLQEQIREYETRLRDAEDRLARFKKDNVGLMPGETGDYYTRLQTGLTRLDDLRAKYRLAEQRRTELNKQLEGEEPTFNLFSEVAEDGTPTDGRITEMRRQLDQLLLQYTEKHPKVIALQETIATLEARAKEQSGKRRATAVPRDPREAAARALDINPVYQNLRMEMSRTQVELAELRSQIGEQESDVTRMRSRVDTIPQIEAELTRLNRDYEVNRTQHQALLQRLESARLSEQAEASTENVKFRIIEPAVRPMLPTGPKRGVLMTGVLFGAIAAGAALAILLAQLRPVFLSRAMLKTVTGLQVLGTISFIDGASAQPLLRRDPVLVSAAFAGLIASYGVGVTFGEPVLRMLRNVLS
jgi:polysaccharide chain length determinant protein (PEP-CTERM system associated)